MLKSRALKAAFAVVISCTGVVRRPFSQIRATATVVAARVMVIAETRLITAKAESTETRGMVMRVRKKNMEIVRTQDDPITSSQISTTLLHVNLPSIMALSAISLCRQE